MLKRRDLLRIGGNSLAAAELGLLAPAVRVSPDITDVCIYGGTAAGVAAAVQVRRMGKRAVLVEPGDHIGGMTSGGLGATDIGNRNAIGGIAREFYRRIRDHYLQTYGPESQQFKDCFDGFRFEPQVAEKILREMLLQAGVTVYLGERLQDVRKRRTRLTEIITERGHVYRALVFIDATYEGDLMALANVAYTTGREANAQYNETLNGIQLGHPHHNFRAPIDPYIVEGNPQSGLLKSIVAEPAGQQGDGDRRVQAYCFRMCLTNREDNRIPFPKPDGYDPERYTLLARYLNKGFFELFGNSKPMPNQKTDTNNHGAFSTDNIGMNYAYPDDDWSVRERIIREHATYQQGLMWFYCHDERVPSDIRERVRQWGLAKDEFTDTGGWPHQLYVREARRMVSDYVMTEHNCRGTATVEDSIGLAAYNMDSHHCRRIVWEGRALNEGDVQVGVSPYPIAYRAIVPRQRECSNLLVPVCLSCSHIAYGSIRMEPVFMLLAQSAATAACMALDRNVAVQGVDVAKLQQKLLEDGQILQWTGPWRSEPSRAAVINPKRLKGIVLDDTEGRKTGEWVQSTRSGDRRVGVGYIHDGNTNKGKVSISYTPDLPEAGEYEIILIFPPHPNRATNVPVTIVVDGKDIATLTVNQRLEEHKGFASLGHFRLPKGKGAVVVVSNHGTDGYVVADGVQFIRPG